MTRRAFVDRTRDYLLAFAITALAMVVRLSLAPWLGERVPLFHLRARDRGVRVVLWVWAGVVEPGDGDRGGRTSMTSGAAPDTGWLWLPSEAVGAMVFTMTGLGILR